MTATPSPLTGEGWGEGVRPAKSASAGSSLPRKMGAFGIAGLLKGLMNSAAALGV
jgi:hypothetical protein